MASSFTGLKLQGLLGRFGKTAVTDIEGYVELPDGKVCVHLGLYTGREYQAWCPDRTKQNRPSICDGMLAHSFHSDGGVGGLQFIFTFKFWSLGNLYFRLKARRG